MKDIVIIEFETEEQQKAFSQWFVKFGFGEFSLSKRNLDLKNKQASCLAADDATDEGHYFQIQ